MNKPEFCRYCGANVPPREAEGTCEICDPSGWERWGRLKRNGEIASILRAFHRNSCYPDAFDTEVACAVIAILEIMDAEL